MTSFDWRKIEPKSLEVSGVKIPKDVVGIFSNVIKYKGYELNLGASSRQWELFDDHGSRIGIYSNTEEGKKSGILALLRTPACDRQAMSKVMAEEADFKKELNQSGLPGNFGPWGAARLCGIPK